MARHQWWQEVVVYQIYPWSFMDSNGDGIGDLPGIRDRLDYLRWLGVGAIWISPIFPSPMADFGYDISDYCDIDPRFGTLADFDALLEDAHRLGLKVILDYVPNHTSDQHAWFLAARSSRNDPFRDYYIWRDPAPDGGPPNNWLSEFGGSAWQWDEQTGQYYYHAYLRQQPDLNWRNPAVVEAMSRVLKFWLERGVDGFRVDTIHHLIKDDAFRDNPPNPQFGPGMPPHRSLIRQFTTDRPEVHALIARMRQVVDAYPNRVLIGEAWLPIQKLVAYYGEGLSGLHLPFNFQLVHARWNARELDAIAREYEAALPMGAWPNWVLGNHDRSRIATRVGEAQARIAALLLLTLRGTPTLYYGDELAMHDVVIAPDRVRDPWESNVPGLGVGRDPERTPMQWSKAPHAGFTEGEPWLPVADDYRSRNVEVERGDPGSMLSLYRAILELRRAVPALRVGSYAPVDLSPAVFSFRRDHDGQCVVVLLNFAGVSEELTLPDDLGPPQFLLSTNVERSRGVLERRIVLAPHEGLVFSTMDCQVRSKQWA